MFLVESQCSIVLDAEWVECDIYMTLQTLIVNVFRHSCCLTATRSDWLHLFWCFSDHASWIDHILITNSCALIIIYSKNINLLCMFRASSAHLQEDTVVHMQRMVLSLCKQVSGRILYSTTHQFTEWQYHTLHVYNCILRKMSTWGSKHAEEINILWMNNNQCTKVGN